MGLGLSGAGDHSGEIRVGFRRGLVRYLGITIGGAGILGLVVAVLGLAQKEPQRFFDLLSRWGFVWLLSLAAMGFAWDLVGKGIGHIGRLADSMHESAIAVNRIADRDDRERDRMQMEIAFVGGRMEKLSADHEKTRDEMRDHHREVVDMISKVLAKQTGARGHGDGD
jgi:hypothetical protein